MASGHLGLAEKCQWASVLSWDLSSNLLIGGVWWGSIGGEKWRGMKIN